LNKNLLKYLFGFAVLLFVPDLLAQSLTLPEVKLGMSGADNPKQVVGLLKILGILTVLTLAPAILIMMTSFTRIVIVLSFVRQALGTQQMPPNQLILGLALFITFFVMSPVFTKVNTEAIQPYLKNSITQEVAFDKALAPFRGFMFNQTRDSDLALFVKLSKMDQPKTSFQIGFIIYLPFLVIDMITASVLMAMGMMMLPPVIISLPFKIMLFVFVDGWSLLIGSLVKSFG